MPYAGRIARAADLLADSITPYTPAWTASITDPTIGNGAIEGSYYVIWPILKLWIRIDFGSTSSGGSGDYYLSLPSGFAMNTAYADYPVGCAYLNDLSAGFDYPTGKVNIFSSTTVAIRGLHGVYASSYWNSGIPITLQSGDWMALAADIPIA